jgi:hypothetical protein
VNEETGSGDRNPVAGRGPRFTPVGAGDYNECTCHIFSSSSSSFAVSPRRLAPHVIGITWKPHVTWSKVKSEAWGSFSLRVDGSDAPPYPSKAMTKRAMMHPKRLRETGGAPGPPSVPLARAPFYLACPRSLSLKVYIHPRR